MTEKTFLDNLANGDAAEPVDAAELGDVDSKITESNDGQTMRSRNGHRSHNKSRATFPTQTLLSKFATRVHQGKSLILVQYRVAFLMASRLEIRLKLHGKNTRYIFCFVYTVEISVLPCYFYSRGRGKASVIRDTLKKEKPATSLDDRFSQLLKSAGRKANASRGRGGGAGRGRGAARGGRGRGGNSSRSRQRF